MKKRTIIMLSAKRCGSTAIFKMFQKHPEVKIAHINQNIALWEPNFWNFAAMAINGSKKEFIERLRKNYPFLQLPEKFNDETVFMLWDQILEHFGPVVFDKSPQYLGNKDALQLLQRYIKNGGDVKMFAFIRDPRDAIASMYENWRPKVGEYLKIKEVGWLKKYSLLEELQESFDIPLFRYEEFAQNPNHYAPILLRHCGCSVIKDSYSHIKPTSIGRYSASLSPKIWGWKFSTELKEHFKKYGYKSPQATPLEKISLRAKTFKKITGKILKKLT